MTPDGAYSPSSPVPQTPITFLVELKRLQVRNDENPHKWYCENMTEIQSNLLQIFEGNLIWPKRRNSISQRQPPHSEHHSSATHAGSPAPSTSGWRKRPYSRRERGLCRQAAGCSQLHLHCVPLLTLLRTGIFYCA